jgi:hypothetical protein
MLLALINAVAAIRVTREELSGVNPTAAPADWGYGPIRSLL